MADCDNAICSASLELNTTLHCTLERKLIVAWFKIIINPDTLIIGSLLLVKAL